MDDATFAVELKKAGLSLEILRDRFQKSFLMQQVTREKSWSA